MRLLALCCAAFLGASCGLVGSDPLERAASSLRDIRSGTLGFRLLAETEGGQEAGFFLRGVFSLPEGAELPLADLSYGRLGISGEPDTGFVSTGEAAFVEVDGQAYELPPAAVESLVGAAEPADEGPFGELELEDWVKEPEVSDGRPIDANGGESVVIEGDLDVVRALNDLLDLARGTGGFDVPPLEGEEAERLEAAVESARLETMTDDDDVFRRLEIEVELGADAPESLSEPLADLLGVGFKLQVSIDEPNEPVHVERRRTPVR